MRRFLLNFFIVIIPTIVFLAIPYYYFQKYKEYPKLENALKTFTTPNTLFGPRYDPISKVRYVKYQYLIRANEYDIWALGASRVLEFRSFMFSKSFFNDGFTVDCPYQTYQLLKKYPKSKLPKYILWGIDQPYVTNKEDGNELDVKEITDYNNFIFFIPDFYHDLFDKKFSNPFNNGNKNSVGLMAYYKGFGLRNDGSMDYGNEISPEIHNTDKNVDYNFRMTKRRVNRQEPRYQWYQKVSDRQIAYIDSILNYCKENGVYVTGFLPAYPPGMYYYMHNSGKYNYFDAIPAVCSRVFNKYGFKFFNFTLMKGTTDSEYIDGEHPGEYLYTVMLSKIYKDDITARQYINSNIDSIVHCYTNPFKIGTNTSMVNTKSYATGKI